jgi:hypothetical protein
MRLLTVVATRALSKLSGQATTALSIMAFLAAVGAFFADGLFAAEGTAVSAPSIWALSVARVLPLLTSLLTMRLWSGDGVAERLESDLVVPVPERVFAQGRFAAAYAAVLCAIAMSLVVPLFVLPWCCSPVLSTRLDIVRFIPAFAALAVFALPLTAIGSMAGAIFRNAVSAAVASSALTCAVPFAAYKALLSWNPAARMTFAEAPVMSQIADAADGSFSFGAVAVAGAFASFALFAASKSFAMRRIACDGRTCLKISSVFSMLLALTAATLLSVIAIRLDFMVEWPGTVRTASISARTREILSGISSPVRISACMRRDSPEFLPASRLLRIVAAASRSSAGAGVTCEFVDPRWDPNAARRLVRAGAGENSIVFSAERRRITVPAKDLDESACASAIQRLSMPARSETVLFTTGHGEPSINDFGPSGMGDAARALRQEGYRTGSLFFPTSSLPADCAVLVVAGARTPFSAAELRDIGAFITQGGRLLVTDGGDPEAGVRRILERLGMAELPAGGSAGTTDGSNITVSDFGDHAVSIPLQGSAVVFAPGAHRFAVPAPQTANGHGFSVTALCPPGASSYAVAVEKGSMLRSDLAIRPARMVAIGDPSFFLNGTFASRANANRDFFLNAIAWLAGMDVSGAVGVADNILSVRMDRSKRIRFLLYSSVAVPFCAASILWLPVRRRRRRMR